MQVGQHSQLQEWMQDLDNPEDKHRHVSHLFGFIRPIKFRHTAHRNYLMLPERH